MMTTIGRMTIALLLSLAAWACWREAGLAAEVADATERLATLRPDLAAAAPLAATVSDYLPGSRRSLGSEAARQQATVEYWLSRYDAAMDMGRGEVDADVLQVAANAAYRAGQFTGVAGPSAVQQLDGVLQAYALVLKAGPRHADAAYNYEFVARVRDRVASTALAVAPKPARGEHAHGQPSMAPQPVPAPVASSPVNGDLPTGPTVHGRPGAPPPTVKGEDFQIKAPMDFGDREAQPQPTPGGRLPRKG